MSKSAADSIFDATLWLIDGRTVSDRELEGRMDWLGLAERRRYADFMRPQRRRQFLLGRILLRLAVGRLLDIQPSEIVVAEKSGAAPVIQGLSSAVGYSLSHSGPWVACAVSRQVKLGVDIEMLDAERDLAALAEHVFDADELPLFYLKDGKERVAAFYEKWSMQEAAYKLSAQGHTKGEHFSVFPHPAISMVLCSEQPLQEVHFHDDTNVRVGLF